MVCRSAVICARYGRVVVASLDAQQNDRKALWVEQKPAAVAWTPLLQFNVDGGLSVTRLN
jgi:hypothetical protein